MIRVKALLLDVGNVVVRLKAPQLFGAMVSNCPDMDEAALKATLRDEREGLHIDYECGRASFDEFHADFVEHFGMTWSRDEFLAVWLDYFETNKPFEVLLAKLKGHVSLWGLSNTNAEHLAHVKRMFRVFDIFERVIGSHELGLRKPEPEIFKKAVEIVGLPASQILFVDDMLKNIEAAKVCGLQAFHYTFNDAAFKQRLIDLGLDIPEWDSRASNLSC